MRIVLITLWITFTAFPPKCFGEGPSTNQSDQRKLLEAYRKLEEKSDVRAAAATQPAAIAESLEQWADFAEFTQSFRGNQMYFSLSGLEADELRRTLRIHSGSIRAASSSIPVPRDEEGRRASLKLKNAIKIASDALANAAERIETAVAVRDYFYANYERITTVEVAVLSSELKTASKGIEIDSGGYAEAVELVNLTYLDAQKRLDRLLDRYLTAVIAEGTPGSTEAHENYPTDVLVRYGILSSYSKSSRAFRLKDEVRWERLGANTRQSLLDFLQKQDSTGRPILIYRDQHRAVPDWQFKNGELSDLPSSATEPVEQSELNLKPSAKIRLLGIADDSFEARINGQVVLVGDNCSVRESDRIEIVEGDIISVRLVDKQDGSKLNARFFLKAEADGGATMFTTQTKGWVWGVPPDEQSWWVAPDARGLNNCETNNSRIGEFLEAIQKVDARVTAIANQCIWGSGKITYVYHTICKSDLEASGEPPTR